MSWPTFLPPFSADELRDAHAHGGFAPGPRIETVARQHAALVFDGLTIDLEQRRVTRDGAEVHLTPTEYSLLKYLSQNAGRVLTHPMILRAVWGAEYAADTNLLRTYINQLRSKIGDGYVRTEPGVGYRFAELAES